MSFEPGTDTILDALRTALGTSLVITGVTYTFAWVVEGPLEEWLEAGINFPMIVLDPDMTEVTDATGQAAVFQLQERLPVGIYIVLPKGYIHENPGVPPTRYALLRKIGEALLTRIMAAGPDMGTGIIAKKELLGYGRVNIRAASELAPAGVMAYGIQMAFRYYDKDQ